MKSYVYQWIHVPRGMCGLDSQRFACSAAFMRCMRRWNANQPGVWVYRLVGVES